MYFNELNYDFDYLFTDPLLGFFTLTSYSYPSLFSLNFQVGMGICKKGLRKFTWLFLVGSPTFSFTFEKRSKVGIDTSSSKKKKTRLRESIVDFSFS